MGVNVRVMTDGSLPLVREPIPGIQPSIIENNHGETRDAVLPVEQTRSRGESVSRFA